MAFTTTDAILDATVLKQITGVQHRTGAGVRRGRTSGGATVSETYGYQAEEVTSLTTTDLNRSRLSRLFCCLNRLARKLSWV